eukprot:Nitzschia sp. Nitz4//scaffold244_size29068//24813//25745//NITZ4_008067-RA/size29068-processed-gene-0.9-mRNA-1//1//CDS//3329543865//8020//frame0
MTFPDVQDKVMKLVVHLPRGILQLDNEVEGNESSEQQQEMLPHPKLSLIQQELDEELVESEHLRVEQHREHQHHSEVYQRIHAQWIQAIQPVLILPPPFAFPEAAMHQAMLESMLLHNDKDALSPRVLTKMSQVCYCVHRLTRVELFTTSIHEEYRTLVNWMHGTLEETETIRQLLQGKVDQLQEQRVQAQQAHQAKLKQMEYEHLKQKCALLKIRLEERKRLVGKQASIASGSASPDGTVKTVPMMESSPNSDTLELLGGGSDTTDSESMHSVDLDLGEWDEEEEEKPSVPPFLRNFLPVQLFATAKSQ